MWGEVSFGRAARAAAALFIPVGDAFPIILPAPAL
jgi:hypothetical protein